MAIDVDSLGYLLPSDTQMLSHNGKPLTGGHIEVYEAGTDKKYITYSDFDGTQNPFSILIPNDGRVVVLGEITKSYDYYVYDSYRNLVFSRKNITLTQNEGSGIRELDEKINTEIQERTNADSEINSKIESIDDDIEDLYDKLDKSGKIFETVDDLKKADLSLNDIAITKRYYSYSNTNVFKDAVPGGNQYAIVDYASLNANDRNYGIGKDVIQLNNGLYAKAILGDEAFPEQIGYIIGYSQANSMDLTPYIERLGQTGVTTIKLGKTGHVNNWYDGDGVYRIRDKCNLTRSIKIKGIHDVVSGYATRIYFVPSNSNTDKVMFDITARGCQLEDLILVEATERYSQSSPTWSFRQGTAIRLDRGTSSLMTELRRCAFQWFQYGIYTRDFTWHTTFAELQFASNYVNVHLGKLMYTTTFYNCLFNSPIYRNVEAISSPHTLEFNSCNFGMNKDNDTLFYVDRWYGEIVEVNERGGIFTFNNCNFEVEIKDTLYPNDNPGLFLKNTDRSLSNFNYNNCVFIVTPLARAQRRNCRYFSVGPGGTIHFKNCIGPYEDVDIQDPSDPTKNNYFIEKDFAKYFIDENRGCRKCIGGITVENCTGIDVISLAKASYLSAIKTDSNIILTRNSTDITKYDAIPNGTIMLNLSNHKNASVIENKMFYINEIPGNFVKIGNDLYEYVEINGRAWINRNFYTRTPGRNDQYWNHLDWGLYYRNDEDQNIVPLLPSDWDFANGDMINELVGDGSAERAHALQGLGFNAFPDATNETGFNMPPSYQWIRPYDASETNFTQGLFCGTALEEGGVRSGCYVFVLNADSVSRETWDISTMNSTRLPYRFCSK